MFIIFIMNIRRIYQKLLFNKLFLYLSIIKENQDMFETLIDYFKSICLPKIDVKKKYCGREVKKQLRFLLRKCKTSFKNSDSNFEDQFIEEDIIILKEFNL